MRKVAGGGHQRGAPWSEEELVILASHPELSAADMVNYLPHRTPQAIGNMRGRHCPPDKDTVERPQYAAKPTGHYPEMLADLLVDDFECFEIWLRWNGYTSAREVSRNLHGWVTLICEVK